ncbi:uncharacterized protein BJ171DRAFT_122582 [Polychytrium aggregatum]|uniref:uncharacterized protein n=1 Tax=Polychytrium aggregatum TaxID=110093 RepID=UPI0022FE24C2|nr:uncharacterized protein BJ171DRAFT_122582 [Polychytrium aggregatum]KAI9204300.1 hypothetical protein BJ171DRAFT_122582 [Polychytrium aggregatum]
MNPPFKDSAATAAGAPKHSQSILGESMATNSSAQLQPSRADPTKRQMAVPAAPNPGGSLRDHQYTDQGAGSDPGRPSAGVLKETNFDSLRVLRRSSVDPLQREMDRIAASIERCLSQISAGGDYAKIISESGIGRTLPDKPSVSPHPIISLIRIFEQFKMTWEQTKQTTNAILNGYDSLAIPFSKLVAASLGSSSRSAPANLQLPPSDSRYPRHLSESASGQSGSPTVITGGSLPTSPALAVSRNMGPGSESRPASLPSNLSHLAPNSRPMSPLNHPPTVQSPPSAHSSLQPQSQPQSQAPPLPPHAAPQPQPQANPLPQSKPSAQTQAQAQSMSKQYSYSSVSAVPQAYYPPTTATQSSVQSQPQVPLKTPALSQPPTGSRSTYQLQQATAAHSFQSAVPSASTLNSGSNLAGDSQHQLDALRHQIHILESENIRLLHETQIHKSKFNQLSKEHNAAVIEYEEALFAQRKMRHQSEDERERIENEYKQLRRVFKSYEDRAGGKLVSQASAAREPSRASSTDTVMQCQNCDGLSDEIRELQDRLASISTENSSLKKQLEQLIFQADDLRNTAKLSEQQRALQKRDHDKLVKELEQTREQFSQLSRESSIARQLHENSTPSSSQKDTETRDIVQQLEAAVAHRDRLTNQLQILHARNEKLTKHQDDMKQRHEVLRSSAEELYSRCEQLKKELEQQRRTADSQWGAMKNAVQKTCESLNDIQKTHLALVDKAHGLAPSTRSPPGTPTPLVVTPAGLLSVVRTHSEAVARYVAHTQLKSGATVNYDRVINALQYYLDLNTVTTEEFHVFMTRNMSNCEIFVDPMLPYQQDPASQESQVAIQSYEELTTIPFGDARDFLISKNLADFVHSETSYIVSLGRYHENILSQDLCSKLLKNLARNTLDDSGRVVCRDFDGFLIDATGMWSPLRPNCFESSSFSLSHFYSYKDDKRPGSFPPDYWKSMFSVSACHPLPRAYGYLRLYLLLEFFNYVDATPEDYGFKLLLGRFMNVNYPEAQYPTRIANAALVRMQTRKTGGAPDDKSSPIIHPAILYIATLFGISPVHTIHFEITSQHLQWGYATSYPSCYWFFWIHERAAALAPLVQERHPEVFPGIVHSFKFQDHVQHLTAHVYEALGLHPVPEDRHMIMWSPKLDLQMGESNADGERLMNLFPPNTRRIHVTYPNREWGERSFPATEYHDGTEKCTYVFDSAGGDQFEIPIAFEASDLLKTKFERRLREGSAVANRPTAFKTPVKSPHASAAPVTVNPPRDTYETWSVREAGSLQAPHATGPSVSSTDVQDLDRTTNSLGVSGIGGAPATDPAVAMAHSVAAQRSAEATLESKDKETGSVAHSHRLSVSEQDNEESDRKRARLQ